MIFSAVYSSCGSSLVVIIIIVLGCAGAVVTALLIVPHCGFRGFARTHRETPRCAQSLASLLTNWEAPFFSFPNSFHRFATGMAVSLMYPEGLSTTVTQKKRNKEKIRRRKRRKKGKIGKEIR